MGVGLLRPRRLAAAALRALGHLLRGDPKPFGERGGLDKGLGRHLAASLERVAVGFALSAVVGVALGMTVGPSKLAIRALDPLFQVLHTVPPLAWLPLSLAAFREAQPSAIFVIVITAVWPIIINAAGGVRDVPAAPLVPKAIERKIREGEYIAVIGHSGCGKSTLRNVLAGLQKAAEGGVVLAGTGVDEPGPDRAVVFQNHSLLPWLTVYENMRLAVDRMAGRCMSRAERDAWTRENLALVRMEGHAQKRPAEISGGMKQRVGIARALAMRPKVPVLDEPFGALDALTRAHLQGQVMDIHARRGTSVMMITHDVDEAVLLSDRIVMMMIGPNATTGDILGVDLPCRRDRLALACDPRILAAREAALRFLHQRHALPAAA